MGSSNAQEYFFITSPYWRTCPPHSTKLALAGTCAPAKGLIYGGGGEDG
jgi:hypothetical protein